MPHTLAIGPIRLEWQLNAGDPRWQEFLTAYQPYLDHQPGQLVVEAVTGEVDESSPRRGLPNSLIRARVVRGSDFNLGEGLVTGCLAAPDLVQCRVHPLLLAGRGLRVLEHFFYLLFNHAALAMAEQESQAPFMLHSSGILFNGGARLFCGSTGSGKSTAVELCPVTQRLGDEAMVLSSNGQGLTVFGSPINPFFTDKSAGKGPLEWLYLIEHGSAHELLSIERQDAVPRLVPEIVLPLGLLETDLQLGLARSLSRAMILYDTGRVKRLAFRPDPGFWDHLV
jgi:hypothetical protein